jgi:hypothetical protein
LIGIVGHDCLKTALGKRVILMALPVTGNGGLHPYGRARAARMAICASSSILMSDAHDATESSTDLEQRAFFASHGSFGPSSASPVMKLFKSIKAVTPPPPESIESIDLSERGYFWSGCCVGFVYAIALYVMVRLIADLLM